MEQLIRHRYGLGTSMMAMLLFNIWARVGTCGLAASIEADEAFITATDNVDKLGIGGVDPFNGQAITAEQVGAARRGRDYFKWTKWNKIEAVSDWMEKNY